MRVLVAGGAGFIGAAFCAALLDRGDEVVCVDNMVTGSKNNVEELSARPGFQFVYADVSEEVPVPGRVDAVVNLACPASPADFSTLALEILAVGSRGAWNLLEVALAKEARFLQASTSEVYGQPEVHPQHEEYWGHVNPVGERSVYDEAKRFGEALTMAFYRGSGADTRIARIFNTYGPRMRADDGRVISNLVNQALRNESLTVYGDGTQTRSFCYVDDLAAGLVGLLDSDYHQPVNLGNDEEVTMLQVAELVQELTGCRSGMIYQPLPADDPSQRRPDLTVAREVLGWAPAIPLREGLPKAISWFAAALS
ncbi:MAG: NAD-dependent epimerase/dehydratase family protein [Acidimicrobiales bacterium]